MLYNEQTQLIHIHTDKVILS